MTLENMILVLVYCMLFWRVILSQTKISNLCLHPGCSLTVNDAFHILLNANLQLFFWIRTVSFLNAAVKPTEIYDYLFETQFQTFWLFLLFFMFWWIFQSCLFRCLASMFDFFWHPLRLFSLLSELGEDSNCISWPTMMPIVPNVMSGTEWVLNTYSAREEWIDIFWQLDLCQAITNWQWLTMVSF